MDAKATVGLMNEASGCPGQPEKGSGQQELGVCLTDNQDFPMFFLNISDVSLMPSMQ